MFGINDLWIFIVSGLVLNILPGPDSLYIIGRSASQGFKAGSAAALGIGSGTMVHVFAAAFGLSAILATSATAFMVVKFVGGCYLLYMAFCMLRSQTTKQNLNDMSIKAESFKTIYVQGFLTNVLNPKVALFFLAFVPQFIDSAATNKTLSFIVLGLVFNLNGMVWCHFLAWSSAVTGKKIKQHKVITTWLTRTAAGFFAYFGLRLPFSERG